MSKKDISIIKNIIYSENERVSYIDIDDFCDDECKNFIQAIENILKENESNKKKIEELEIVILKDYISKFVIKETLEELQTEYKIALEENSIQAFILKCKIEGLQELLKDGGE